MPIQALPYCVYTFCACTLSTCTNVYKYFNVDPSHFYSWRFQEELSLCMKVLSHLCICFCNPPFCLCVYRCVSYMSEIKIFIIYIIIINISMIQAPYMYACICLYTQMSVNKYASLPVCGSLCTPTCVCMVWAGKRGGSWRPPGPHWCGRTVLALRDL